MAVAPANRGVFETLNHWHPTAEEPDFVRAA
jgi:hypothetical protein